MRQKLAMSALAASLAAAPALAQGAQPAAPSLLMQIFPLLLMIPIFYFLLIRPQQQRAKKHAEMLSALKRGDTVVTSGGLIGKVNKVSDTEISIDLAENVRVRVVRSMILEVRNKAEPVPAND
jgi:preprotein translocase subunit YajC